MIVRLALWLLLVAAPLSGQLQFSTVVGSNDVETAVGTSLDLGSHAVGDTTPTRLRLRNIGSTNFSLTVLKCTASPIFTLNGSVNTPYILTPGSQVDFSVSFLPSGPGSYSASLTVNTTNYLVTATAYATAQVGVRDSSSTVTLAAGTPYDFGQIEIGSSVVKHFVIRNAGSAAVSISAITLSGAAFSSTNAPKAPVILPVQQELTFDILCAPPLAGVQQGLLQVDGLAYPLNAFATAPALPQPAITTDTGTITNAQQVKVGVTLAAASKVSGTGTLQVDVLPLTAGLPDDASIQFTASGSRAIPFQVSPGNTQGLFNGQPYAILQTGTISGTLRLTVTLGGLTQQMSLPVATALPYIANASTSHTTSSVGVQVAGYDNTRSLTGLAFTFYDVTGAVMPGGVIRADATQAFQQYFSTNTAGGLFQVQATFPVTGSVSLIGSVVIELTSNAGTKRTDTIRF